jgi:hypothetical protein
MALAWDPNTGTVREGAAEAPVTSGVPDSVLKTGKVPMLDNVGNPVFVDSKDVDSAVSQGFKYESPEQETERKTEEKYGNSPFLAGTLGATRSLTFGLSDLAGRGLGFADALREIKQRNEISSTAGEVTGAVAPLLLTLGASAPVQTAARGAVLAGEAATVGRAAGVAAEAAALGKAGTTLGTLGNIAKVTAPSLITKGSEAVAKKLVAEGWKRAALQGAVEGAGFGAGQAVTDIALTEGDITPDRVAESLISNIGMGAFMGGTLSLGAYGVGKGLGKVTGTLKNRLKGALNEAEDVAMPGKSMTDDDWGVLEHLARKGNAEELITAAKEAGIDPKNIPAEVLAKSPKLQAMAMELEKRNTLAGWRQNEKAQGFKEKVSDYARKIFSDIPDTTDLQAGETIKSALLGKMQSSVETIGKGFQKVRESTKFIPVPEQTKAKLVKQLVEIPEYKIDKVIRGQVDDLINSVTSASTVDDLKLVQTILNKNVIGPANRSGQYESARVLRDALGKLRDVEENTIIKAAIEQAPTRAEGAKIGKQLADELATSRAQWKELHDVLDDVFGSGGAKVSRGRTDVYKLMDKFETMSGEDMIRKMSSSRNFRALEKLKRSFPEEFGVVQSHFLSKVKQGSINPDESFNALKMVKQLNNKNMSPESVKLFLGSQYKNVQNVQKLVSATEKTFANNSNTGSTVFNQAAAMSSVLNVVGQIKDMALYSTLYHLPKYMEAVAKTEGKMNTKIAQFVSHATKQTFSAVRGGAVVIANNMKEKNYQGRLDKLEDLAANPQKVFDHVVDATSGASNDPALQSALQSKGIQAANYLIEKMPKKPDTQNIFGATSTYKPSDQELSKWNRYVRAVDNPMTILDDLNAGILTPESVDAVRVNYPEIYGQISQKMIGKLSEVKKPISYQAKMQVSTLLGIPVTSALGPKFIQAMQGNINSEPQEQQPKRINAGQVGKSKFSERSLTPTQSLLGG